jgi:hypothetical protein
MKTKQLPLVLTLAFAAIVFLTAAAPAPAYHHPPRFTCLRAARRRISGMRRTVPIPLELPLKLIQVFQVIFYCV